MISPGNEVNVEQTTATNVEAPLPTASSTVDGADLDNVNAAAAAVTDTLRGEEIAKPAAEKVESTSMETGGNDVPPLATMNPNENITSDLKSPLQQEEESNLNAAKRDSSKSPTGSAQPGDVAPLS